MNAYFDPANGKFDAFQDLKSEIGPTLVDQLRLKIDLELVGRYAWCLRASSKFNQIQLLQEREVDI